MAHDKSAPQIGVIVKVAIIGIVTVLGIRFGLTSYFGWMNDKEHFTKYSMQKPQQLIDLRADEAKRLNGGPMPIASSMKLLAADKRQMPGMDPKAADPMREKDTMAGWSQMPRPVPAADEDAGATAPAPSSSAAAGDAAAPTATAEAGAAATTDAAAPPHNPNEHH